MSTLSVLSDSDLDAVSGGGLFIGIGKISVRDINVSTGGTVIKGNVTGGKGFFTANSVQVNGSVVSVDNSVNFGHYPA